MKIIEFDKLLRFGFDMYVLRIHKLIITFTKYRNWLEFQKEKPGGLQIMGNMWRLTFRIIRLMPKQSYWNFIIPKKK